MSRTKTNRKTPPASSRVTRVPAPQAPSPSSLPLDAQSDSASGADPVSLLLQQAQTALQESDARYQALVEMASDAIVILQDGKIAFVNRAGLKLYGVLRADEVIGRSPLNFIHNADRAEVERRITEVAHADLGRGALHCRGIRSDGAVLWIQICAVRIQYRGRPALQATFRDVTEQRRTNDALLVASQRLQLIAQMTSAVVGSTPLFEQVRHLAGRVRSAFGADACVIRLLEGAQLRLLASSGIAEDKLVLNLPIIGLAAEVIERGQPLFVQDIRHHPMPRPSTGLPPYDFVSYAGALLTVEREIVGIIGLFWEKEIDGFTDADLQQLQIVADHVSVSIVNDKLYEQLQERKDALEKQMVERRRTEEALRKSELQLRLVWENSIDGMRLADADGKVLLVNEAYCKMAGKPRFKLEGQPISVIYDPERSAEVIERHKERFQTHSIPSHTEREIVLWNGKKLFVEVTNTLIDFEGQQPLVLALFRDITARREADRRNVAFAALSRRLSAARTEKEVADSVLTIAWELLGWDAAYVVRYFPETQAKAPILYIDTMDGHRVEVPLQEVRPELSPRLQKVISEGGQIVLRDNPDDLTGFSPFGDRSRPSASILAVPIHHKGNVIGVVSIQSYIVRAYRQDDVQTLQTLADLCGSTLERINAEHALIEERNLLRTLIDNLPDYIYVKDLESRHLLHNAAYLRLLGLGTGESVIGKTALEHFPPELAAEYRKDDQTVMQSAQPLIEREEPMVDSNGNRRWLLTTKVPFRDEAGVVCGLVGISRDITDHKLAETRSAGFSSLGHRLSAASNMEDAARVILGVADELLGWDACYLHLCSPGTDTVQTILNIDEVNGRRKDFPSQLRRPSERMLKAMREGGQLILREDLNEPMDGLARFGNTSRLSASLMIVPVRNNQNVIGVLSIQSYKKYAYDHKALETLQALADHCSGALERLKNERERKATEQRNAVLSRLARSLSSAMSEEEAGQIIVAAANELFGWDSCIIDLYDGDKNIAHSLVVIDTIDGKRVPVEDLPDSPPSPMARRVFEHGPELVLRQPGSGTENETIPFGDTARPSASLMNVPIRNAERGIGILSIQSYSANAYTNEDLATLQALADYCGGALERIRGSEALRESEERFRSLSESMPVGIFQADADGRRTYLNARWYSISGMSYGEGLGDDWVRALHPEERQEVVESWLAALSDGREWISEHRFVTPGGARWVRTVATPITSKHGKRVGYVGAVEDITERRRVEQRNAVFSKLGQTLSSASTRQLAARVIGDIAEELFHWDAFSLDLYAPESDLCTSVLNIDTIDGKKVDVPHTNPTDRPTARARRVMEKGAELILKDNPEMPLGDAVPFGNLSRPSASIMLVPLRDKQRVVGIMSVQSYTPKAYDPEDLRMLQLLADYCSGALERIRAEEALRTSEVRFHSVWENSVDGMRLTDENGTIIAVNESYCKLVGMPRQELEGRVFTTVYDESTDVADFMRKYKLRFERRLAPKLVKRSVVFRGGKAVDLENANSYIESKEGRTLLLGLFRDVTAQTRLEEELRQSQKLESIGRLAGGVAHDFNNILTVINGHAEMLLMEKESLTIDVADSIEQIGKAAERAAGLTRQLLAFGRKQIMQARNVDVNEVVSNMTKMLQRVLGEDIALQVSFHSNLPAIHADPMMIEQILLNLAVNSRDAMPKGGELLIRTNTRFVDESEARDNPEAHAGQFVCMSITDTGCGIPADNLSKIFEPFFTTKDVGKGTGLGLATVYGIIKQHHGWVTVASELGKGTTFDIYFPTAGGRAAETDAVQKSGMRGGNEVILLVEDEPEVRNLALAVLKKLGYDCIEARTGRDAIDVWVKHKDEIDLVLTDIVMPDGMSGRDLAEELHRQKPGLKVLFTSGYPKDVVGKDFVLREGVNFLQKPYYPQKLAEAIRDCLDSGNIIHQD